MEHEVQTYVEIRDFLNAKSVELVAVSKTKPNSAIFKLYGEGQRIFGENRVQELVDKHESLPKDIQWHMIGHLQRNKVKYIAPFVDLIHSVDSERLLAEIDKQANNNNRVIKVLLQAHIADETNKFGFSIDELTNFHESEEAKNYPNVEIVGLMGMATFTDNEQQIASEFFQLKQLYDYLNSQLQTNYSTLSMGMSGDYEIAIQKGANMVRLGSLLFGAR